MSGSRRSGAFTVMARIAATSRLLMPSTGVVSRTAHRCGLGDLTIDTVSDPLFLPQVPPSDKAYLGIKKMD